MIVSGLLFPGSLPGQAFSEARVRGDVLLSDAAVEEIVGVMRRPKFDRYVLAEERDRFVAKLIREARHAHPSETVHACRDPKDDKWLELATAGNAAQIITGDGDLLTLGSFGNIPIVTPAKFVQSLADWEAGAMKKNRHSGSDFDDFLEKDGLLADAEAVAVKRVVAFQIAQMLKKQRI